MKTTELKNFYNKGFGWVCKTCEAELSDKTVEKSRLLKEGEAESKQPIFSNKAMAKWTDEKRDTLICPNCEISEKVFKLIL